MLLTVFADTAHAHSASTSYLKFEAAHGNEVAFNWRIALRDVDALLDLDANHDGRLTWGEVDDRAQDLVQLATRSLQVRSASDCPLAFAAPRVEQVDGSGFLQLSGRARCAEPPVRVTVTYRLFAGIDPSHRALVTVPDDVRPALLAPAASQSIAVGAAVSDTGKAASAAPTADHGFRAMLADGVLHILTGFDHMLFLVALMLPAVLERRNGRWMARTHLRAALAQVAWIATAFTIAHSITLGLASFNVVRVPARVIEPLIAVTVLATALNNLWPIVTARVAVAAFGFGLIHGFGFAEVLAPLNLPTFELARALLAFNLGVEGGQLIVVGTSFALLGAARRWHGYPRWILGGGSAMLALVAGAWIIERVFDVALIAL
jgi:hypothetical protein